MAGNQSLPVVIMASRNFRQAHLSVIYNQRSILHTVDLDMWYSCSGLLMLICSFELSSAFNLLDSLPLLLREPAGKPARNLLAHLLCPLSPHSWNIYLPHTAKCCHH